MPEDAPKEYGSIKQSVQASADGDSLEIELLPEDGKISSLPLINRLLKARLEIFTFVFTFSSVLSSVTSTTMILEKVCLVHFGYNSSVCEELVNGTNTENSVEKVATNYQLGHNLIQTVPAAVLACSIGPWSDHYGRKLPIMLALIGMIVDSFGSTICAYFLETRVEYYFIPAVFSGLFGGSVAIKAIVYSCCSDSSTLRERTMKYAFIEMAFGFGTSFGTSAGGWVFKRLGFTAVFMLSTGGLCTALLFGIFLINDTRQVEEDDDWSVKLKKLFSCKMLKEAFSAIIKSRPHNGRKQVILLILSMCFIIITLYSTGVIDYLYAHHRFGWDNSTYSNISAIYSIIGIGVFIIIIPLLMYFRITDPYLGLLGTISLLGKSLGIGLSRKPIVYHIASVAGLIGGCSAFAVRSRISKVVDSEDLGKIFTFVATVESLLPIVASVVVSQVYTACINFFPGMPYIMLGVGLLLPLAVFSWMICSPKIPSGEVGVKNHSEEDINSVVQ